MKFLDNIKMGPKLIVSFLITAAIAVVIGLFAVIKLEAIHVGDLKLFTNGTEPLEVWADITSSTFRIRANLRDILLTGELEKFEKRINARMEQHEKAEKEFEKTILSEKAKEIWKSYQENQAKVNSGNKKFLDLYRSGKKAEALSLLMGEMTELQQEQNKIYEDMSNQKVHFSKGLAEENEKTADNSKKLMYILMGFGALLAAGLGIIISRSISRPLQAGVSMMNEMAKGHLSSRLKMERKDEIGTLAQAMDTFTDDLQKMVQGLQAIAAGDLSRDFVAIDGQDEINPALKKATEALRGMSADAQMLARAGVEGKLATRADAAKYQGEYRKIVQGVNETLDAVVAPVTDVQRVMGAVENGDLTARITVQYQGDFQKLAQAINNSAIRLGQALSEISGAANTLASSADELSSTSSTMAVTAEGMTQQANTAAAGTEQASANVKNMAAGIEQISANSNTVASASEEVNANLRTVGAAVEQMSANMRTIAGATEQMTSSVNTVAAAIEEMSVSLNEVSKNSGQAATVAGKAARAAGTTADTVDKLGKSAQEIGKVVDMIKGIAAQTNLLALNATIEAASAGEAGKGFAVVANEVKELAKQTAGATEEIRAQVEGMQANTQQAVKAIDEIVQIINEINNISGTIAAAVEEQTATTNEISKNVGHAARGASDVAKNVQQSAAGANEVSKNVQEAVKGVSDITRNINQLAAGASDVAKNAAEASKGMNDVARNVGTVSTAARDTTRGAGDTNTAAKELARLAEKLQASVQMFKLDSRGGSRANGTIHLDDAIQAHSTWKMRLKLFLGGTSQERLDSVMASQDDTCPLGKWIRGEGQSLMGGESEFVKLRRVHSSFHQCAGKVLALNERGQSREASDLLEGEFTRLSNDAVQAMLEIKRSHSFA